MKKYYIIGIALVLALIIGFRLYSYYNYSGELIAILDTYTYHRDNCYFVKKASSDDIVFAKSLKQLAEKNYRSCKSCNPPSNKKYFAIVEKEKLTKAKNEVLAGEYIEIKLLEELFDKGYISSDIALNYIDKHYPKRNTGII